MSLMYDFRYHKFRVYKTELKWSYMVNDLLPYFWYFSSACVSLNNFLIVVAIINLWPFFLD